MLLLIGLALFYTQGFIWYTASKRLKPQSRKQQVVHFECLKLCSQQIRLRNHTCHETQEDSHETTVLDHKNSLLQVSELKCPFHIDIAQAF